MRKEKRVDKNTAGISDIDIERRVKVRRQDDKKRKRKQNDDTRDSMNNR